MFVQKGRDDSYIKPYGLISCQFCSITAPHQLVQSNSYFFHISSKSGLQLIEAPSFAHSKNDPDIFRCSEYVSSGGGDRRWRSMIGRSSWMRLVVSWVWKLNGSSLAKGSPSIITASACALIITYHKEKRTHLNKLKHFRVNGIQNYWKYENTKLDFLKSVFSSLSFVYFTTYSCWCFATRIEGESRAGQILVLPTMNLNRESRVMSQTVYCFTFIYQISTIFFLGPLVWSPGTEIPKL